MPKNKKDNEIIEIDAKCKDKRQPAFGFTNRGELIPCCWLDTQKNRSDKKYQKLLSVSKISEHKSIENIILQPEWIEFHNDLDNNKGFPMCYIVCKKRKQPGHQKQTTYIKQEVKVRKT